LFDDGGAGNGLALVAHQEFKQRKFLRAKIDAVTDLLLLNSLILLTLRNSGQSGSLQQDWIFLITVGTVHL
jgi:hypothetical protein